MTHLCALHVLLTLELVVEINIIFGGVGPRISLSADFNPTVLSPPRVVDRFGHELS
jgi:hypothetical protein